MADSRPNDDSYIVRLEAERDLIDSQIAKLRADIRTINNLILKRKSELSASTGNEKLNLKNSNRIMSEQLIIEILRSSKIGRRTSDIFNEINKRGYNINYNTLRTYVSDMRYKGIILKHKAHSYNWIAKNANGLFE